MLKQTLLLTLILWGTQAACPPGCSKCVKKDSEYSCEICDLSRFYYLTQDAKCELKVLPNCKVPSPSTTSKLCVQCNDDHFFDELAQECVAVPDSKKDANCSVYSLVADCLRCKSGHIVQLGKCVVPSNVIQNCQFQINEEHCEICESGHQLNVARTTCISFTTVNNCSEHQDFICERCKSDYALAINSHLLSRVSLGNLQSSLEGNSDMAVMLSSAKEDCVKKSDSKCQSYDSYGRCATCSASYHPDPVTGKCVLSREPEIFKCKKYSNVTTCAVCHDGFYLSSNKCLERKLVAHCEKYVVDADSCEECSEAFYSAGSSCSLRNSSANINYCIKYEIKKDICAQCEPDYIMSTDKLKCHQKIRFCKDHINAASTGTVTCQLCEPGAIPQNNTNTPPETIACDMRNNEGCVGWEANNSNKCTTCLTGFYWLDETNSLNLCKKYTKKCKSYELKSDNCSECFGNEYLEIIGNAKTCKAYTVRNCKEFEANINECKNCNAGYFKNLDTKECQEYTLVNCKTEEDNKNECKVCNDNHYKADKITCLPNDLWECKTPGANNQCTTCNDGFYLVNGKCLSGTQTGCNPANYTSNKDECTQCMPGYYLDQNKFCKPYTVDNCKGTTNSGFLPTEDGCEDCLPGFFKYNNTSNTNDPKNKKCFKIKIPNCVKSQDLGTNCTECAAGYFGTTECLLMFVQYCKEYSTTANECAKCHLGYQLNVAKDQCTKVEIAHCKTYTENGNTCDACQSGFQANAAKTSCEKTDTIGCTAYTNGLCSTYDTTNFYKVGDIVSPKAPKFCKERETSNQGCKTCIDGYKRESSGSIFECTLITTSNCELNGTNGDCVQCKVGYYLKSTSTITCEKHTARTNCMEYSPTSDACTVCESGFYLTSPTCTAITAAHQETFECGGNSGTTNTAGTVCNQCSNGSKKVAFGNNSLVKYFKPGILKYQTDGKIELLADELYLDSTSNIQRDTTKNNCLQLKAFSGTPATTAISAATKCNKCRYPEIHYLTGGNCTDRTTSKNNCSIYNLADNKCIACKEGLAYATIGSTNLCTESLRTTVTNCKYTSGTSLGCYECDNGFLVDQNDGDKCKGNSSSLVGCREFNLSTPAECKVCQKGWYLSAITKTCFRPENCYLGSNVALGYFCEFCFPGYKPHATLHTKCILADTEDNCGLYMHTGLTTIESMCVKCKEPGKIPHNFKVASNYQFRCVRNILSDMNESYVKLDGSTVTILSAVLPNSNFSVVQDQSIGGSVKKSICLPFDVLNCKTYDFTNLFTPCTACKEGYTLINSTKNGQECVKGGVGGCMTYASPDSCSVCKPDWKLADKTVNTAAKKICIKVPQVPYCEVQKVGQFVCIKCAAGYLLYQDMCHKQKHTNCKHYDFEQEVCFGCEDNFYLKNGTCHEYTEPNCAEYHLQEDQCVLCPPNYYLSDGTCKINTSLNCEIKSTLANFCVSCAPGHYKKLPANNCTGTSCFNPVCLPNMKTNCQVFDRESPDCLVCSKGYFLLGGYCALYTVQNCLIRDSEHDRCELCQDGFYLNRNGSCDQYKVKNCQIKDPNQDFCRQCKMGYYWVKPGFCVKYSVSNCNVYHQRKNVCLSCLPGHYKSLDNNCLKYQKTANCQKKDPTRDFCFTCNPGYFNNFGTCVRYTVYNCALYKPDANMCTTCKNGYFLNKNTCEAYTIRCEQYSPLKNECITCPVGYYLDKGICYVNNGMFCKDQSPFRNGCKSCLSDFYLHEGLCKLRVKSTNCKETMETADLCKSCYKTHFIAAGMCISYARETCKTFDEKKDLCVACEAEKYWMSHNVCEKYTVSNCKSYSATADKCLECEKGEYYLKSGICVKSTKVEECETYSNTQDECIDCEDGHYLVSGSECRRNPSGLYQCIQYMDDTTCSKCALGFFLDKNYCQKSKTIIQNCIAYSGDGLCLTCDSNYLLIENKCEEKIEKSCAEWVDVDNCSTCPANYVLKTNTSSKKICEESGLTDCVEAKFGDPTNLCTKCADKKILHNDACQDPVSPLAGCKVYKKEGECSECEDGFTLTKSANGCVSNFTLMSANCAFGIEQSSPKCRVCMSGHQLDEKRDCVSCGGEGCNVCDPYDATKCLFCKAGYDHDGSKCIKAAAAGLVNNRLSDLDGSVSRLFGWVLSLGSLFLVAHSA